MTIRYTPFKQGDGSWVLQKHIGTRYIGCVPAKLVDCPECEGRGHVTRDLRDMHGLVFYKDGLAPCDAIGCDGGKVFVEVEEDEAADETSERGEAA